jgi:phage terminase large subunit GpA-like protein
MIRAVDIIRRVVKAALKARPVQKVWQWIDQHMIIPMIVGSRNPGPLDTDLMPPMRGLYDIYWQRHVHFVTLAKSARVGGTLFCICCVLHKIANWPGPILWMDPTRKTALRFSRNEMQPHIMECAPVAEQAIISRTTWTTLEMSFRGCTFGIVGSGSAAELAGR